MKVLSPAVLVLAALTLVPAGGAIAQIVDNGWDGSSIITSIGATGSDYYAQSFTAPFSTITKFGVVIKELVPEGQVYIAIAADNGSGLPNYSAPLYRGALINPTPTAAWYEQGLNIPVTIGQKYWVLIDGYDPPGATGNSGIGYSAVQPVPGEGIIWSNYGGVGEWNSYPPYPLAIHVEGTVEGTGGATGSAVPTLGGWGLAAFMASLALASIWFLRR